MTLYDPDRLREEARRSKKKGIIITLCLLIIASVLYFVSQADKAASDPFNARKTFKKVHKPVKPAEISGWDRNMRLVVHKEKVTIIFKSEVECMDGMWSLSREVSYKPRVIFKFNNNENKLIAIKTAKVNITGYAKNYVNRLSEYEVDSLYGSPETLMDPIEGAFSFVVPGNLPVGRKVYVILEAPIVMLAVVSGSQETQYKEGNTRKSFLFDRKSETLRVKRTLYIPTKKNREKISKYIADIEAYEKKIRTLKTQQTVRKGRGFLLHWAAIILFVVAFISLIKTLKG